MEMSTIFQVLAALPRIPRIQHLAGFCSPPPSLAPPGSAPNVSAPIIAFCYGLSSSSQPHSCLFLASLPRGVAHTTAGLSPHTHCCISVLSGAIAIAALWVAMSALPWGTALVRNQWIYMRTCGA